LQTVVVMQSERNLGKRSLAIAALLGTIGVASLSGCTREVIVERPRGCANAVYVRGHHDYYGRWHHSHWTCYAPRAPRHVVVVGVAR
jgi:hypothetical protein